MCFPKCYSSLIIDEPLKILNLISKCGHKGARILEFCRFERYIKLYFSANFDVVSTLN